nr:hypothetical protein [Tanacetum cinerariifolium]
MIFVNPIKRSGGATHFGFKQRILFHWLKKLKLLSGNFSFCVMHTKSHLESVHEIHILKICGIHSIREHVRNRLMKFT